MSLPEPLERFARWFEEAKAAIPVDPNAVVLATVDAQGHPDARVVLLKGFDAHGFVFYTNFQSRKGQELQAHPRAALCFYWPTLERQVRVEGPVRPVTDEEADAYFATRARASQLGAWASDQSRPLASREELQRRFDQVEATYADRPVPRPPHWGGFRLSPQRLELWRARPSRLHERELYTLENGGWTHRLLFP
jgi:pyridoxamine 5'-phosphate oxidase